MHKLLFIIALILAAYGITQAQNFNYTVTTYSVVWNELNAQTEPVDNNNPEIPFIDSVPATGYRYTFTPSN